MCSVLKSIKSACPVLSEYYYRSAWKETGESYKNFPLEI